MKAATHVMEHPVVASRHAELLRPRFTLRANFGWTVVGNIFYAACQFGILFLLVRLGNQEMVGQWALSLAIASPVVLFSNLTLRSVQAADSRHVYAFNDYLALRLVTTSLAICVTAGLALGLGQDAKLALVIITMGLAKGIESVSDVTYGLFQRSERMDLVSRSMILKGILSLVAMALVVFLTKDLMSGVLALAGAWALTLVGYDRVMAARLVRNDGGDHGLWPSWNAAKLRRLAWLALPLGIAGSLNSLTFYLPQVVLARFCGEAVLGVFAALVYLIIPGQLVVNALAESALPRLARHYASADLVGYRRLLRQLLYLAGLLGVAAIAAALLAGPQLIGLIYRRDYAGDPPVFVWLMVAAALTFLAFVVDYGLLASKMFRAQMAINVLTLGVVFVGALIAIPSDGARGAAMALCAALFTQLVLKGSVVLYVARSGK
jgi:O-antigen/teichoic acid export membrane protein